MAVGLPNATRTAKAQAVKDLCAGGTFELRSGAAPAPDAADTGTLIAVYTLQSPAFGTITNGAMSLAGVPLTDDALAADSGATKHFRVKTSGGVHVFQGSVTAGGGGGDAIIDNINIALGQTVLLNSLTYTQPGT
jgi:hypothetical protein